MSYFCCDCKNYNTNGCMCASKIILDLDSIDRLPINPKTEDPMDELIPGWKSFHQQLDLFEQNEEDELEKRILNIINETLIIKYVL